MSSNEQLSNGKLLAGALAATILTALLWQYSLGCAGLCLLVAALSWTIVFFRARTMVRQLTGYDGRRRARGHASVQDAPARFTAPEPPQAHAGSSHFYLPTDRE